MSAEKLRSKLELMVDFRQRLAAFYEARQPLLDLKAKAQNHFLQSSEEEDFRRRGESYLPALVTARDRVGQLISEATEIADSYVLPTELKILPPPLIPGYAQSLNVFQAAIEPQLPFDFELQPSKVLDLVNQTIWAIERDLKSEQDKALEEPRPTVAAAKKAGSGIAAAFRAIFRTETARAILKWIIIVGLGGLILRYVFGVKFEIIGKLLLDKVAK